MSHLQPKFQKNLTKYAIASQQAYAYNSTTIENDIQKYVKIHEAFQKHGYNYRIIHRLSNGRIMVVSDNHSVIIAHRGTHIGGLENSTMEDLQSDARLAFNNDFSDKNLQERLDHTVKVIQTIREEENDNKQKRKLIHLTGHSLGGFSCIFTAIHMDQEYFSRNVASVHTFNAGSSPLFHFRRFDVLSSIPNRITNHHIKNDKISENAYLLPGQFKKYKMDESFYKTMFKWWLQTMNPINWFLVSWADTGAYHSILNFIE